MAKQGDGIDRRRRALLARLGLGAGMAYAAPVLASLSQASASSYSARSGSRPARRPVRRAAPPPPRPEIVVAAPQASDIDLIAAQGYDLLSRDRIAITDRELARFRLPANVTLDQARTQVLGLVPEAQFDLNGVYRPGSLACDADDCAAFEMIGWQPDLNGCRTDVVIGMIDTAVNTDHAALRGVAIDIVPTVSAERTAASAVHGTSIAILLAGRRGTRTPGLLEGVRLVAAQGFHRDAGGQDIADAFDIARSIDRLVARDVGIINLSFAGPANTVLEAVIGAAAQRDIIMVAAAGNEGPRADPLYPAAYDDVLAVTAVDGASRVYRRANSGPHIDFAAPGVQLWTAASVSGGRFRSGTSYAAPFVTAALAVARAREPERRAAELIEDLAAGAIDLGESGRDPVFGWGLVQADGTCVDRGAVVRPAASSG